MRGAGVGARPNVAICLTAPERTRDGERAARRGSTRGYAAHAVRTLRPAGLIGGAMVRRAAPRRSPRRGLPAAREQHDAANLPALLSQTSTGAATRPTRQG